MYASLDSPPPAAAVAAGRRVQEQERERSRTQWRLMLLPVVAVLVCGAIAATGFHRTPNQSVSSVQTLPAKVARRTVPLWSRPAVAGGDADGKRPKHVVFVLADDLGSNDVGYQNNDLVDVMPVISEMAVSAGGVVLTKYYSMQRCTPARSALLTGKHPIEIGMQVENIRTATEFGLPLEETTMADAFKTAGFATHGVGKWNQGHFLAEYLPHNRGFDSWFGYMTDEIDYWLHRNPFESDYKDFFRVKAGADDVEYVDSDAFSMTAFRDELVDVVEQHDADESLFLYFASQAPHGPLPNTVDMDLLSDTQETAIASIGADEGVVRKQYLQLVGILDTVVGDVIDALKEKNMWDDTLFVFASDNGGCNTQGGSNMPLRAGKTTDFEGGLHVPAFVYREKWETEEATAVLKSVRAQAQARAQLQSSAQAQDFSSTVQTFDSFFQVTDWLPTLMEAIGQEDVATAHASSFSRSKWSSITKATTAAPAKEAFLHGTFDDDVEANRILWYSSYTLCCPDDQVATDYCSVCDDDTTTASVLSNGYKALKNSDNATYWNTFPTPESYDGTDNCHVDTSGAFDAVFNLNEDVSEGRDLSDEMSGTNTLADLSALIELAAETEVYPVYMPATSAGTPAAWVATGFICPFKDDDADS